MHNTLESYRIFPYVAWTLVIGFSLFTVLLTKQLEQEFDEIDIAVTNIEMRVGRLEKKIDTVQVTP